MELGGATPTADCWKQKAGDQTSGSRGTEPPKAPGTVIYLDLTGRKNLNTFQVTERLPQVPSPSSLSTRLFSLRTVSSVQTSKSDSQSPGCCSILYPKSGNIQQMHRVGGLTKGLRPFWPLQQAPEAGRLTNHRHPLLTVWSTHYPLLPQGNDVLAKRIRSRQNTFYMCIKMSP